MNTPENTPQAMDEIGLQSNLAQKARVIAMANRYLAQCSSETAHTDARLEVTASGLYVPTIRVIAGAAERVIDTPQGYLRLGL